jgi:predicted chitinase
MGYLDTLTPKQKANAEILVKRLNANGITNPLSQAGILAVVSKESEFIPKNEISWRNTSNSRIRQVFGSRVSGYTDAQLNTLKANDEAFFDAVYGASQPQLGLGNTQKGDGYKYRGRGFNQITGRALYKQYGNDIGVNLIDNPDKLNDPIVAADALIAYFKRLFKSSNARLSEYNTTGINDFKTVIDSVGGFYHANAGWGNSMAKIKADSTGGRATAMKRASELGDYVKQFVGKTATFVKKNFGLTIIVSAVLIVSVYTLIVTLKK